MIFYRRKQPGPFRDLMRFDRMAISMLRAYALGSGPATTIPSGILAFIKTRPELATPDVEYMFPGSPPWAQMWFPGVKAPYADAFGIRPAIMHPDSRGEVLLRSADPRERAAHQVQLLLGAQRPADPARGISARPRDRAAEIDGRISRRRSFARRECHERRRHRRFHPQDDAHRASPRLAPARWGIGPDTVLDPQLQVRGIEQLRVVDASAMPDLVTAHINACVLMMAERAADLIRGKPMLAAAA